MGMYELLEQIITLIEQEKLHYTFKAKELTKETTGTSKRSTSRSLNNLAKTGLIIRKEQFKKGKSGNQTEYEILQESLELLKELY